MLEIFREELNAVEKLSALSAELALAVFQSRDYDALSIFEESAS